jgi:hypothetical protein
MIVNWFEKNADFSSTKSLLLYEKLKKNGIMSIIMGRSVKRYISFHIGKLHIEMWKLMNLLLYFMFLNLIKIKDMINLGIEIFTLSLF